MREVLEGWVELPTPPGRRISSIRSRLEALGSACARDLVSPTPETIADITAAWEKFDKDEQRLLQLRPIIQKLNWTVLIGRIFDVDVAVRRRTLVCELLDRAGKVRAGVISGRIRRSRHKKPKIMLVPG